MLVLNGFEQSDALGLLAALGRTGGGGGGGGGRGGGGRDGGRGAGRDNNGSGSAGSNSNNGQAVGAVGAYSDLELQLAMCMHLSGRGLPPSPNAPASGSKSNLLMAAMGKVGGAGKGGEAPPDAGENSELMGELEVLTSIYPGRVSWAGVWLFGRAAVVVEVEVGVEAEVKKFCGGGGGGGGGGDDNLHLRLIVFNLPSYPAPSAPLYGWVTPSPTGGRLLPQSASRGVSLAAMAHIQAYQMQNEAPAIFDFVQSVTGGLLPILRTTTNSNNNSNNSSNNNSNNNTSRGAPPPPALTLPPPPKGKGTGNGAGAGAGTGAGGRKNAPPTPPTPPSNLHLHDLGSQYSAQDRQHREAVKASMVAAKDPVVVVVEEEILAPPPLPPRPKTNLMEGREYRAALSNALSKGLKGAGARRQAREDLEFVLPTSAMQALLIEETYNEEVLGRAVSLEALSTGTVINCTKLLAEALNINKGKARALVQEAREALMKQGIAEGTAGEGEGEAGAGAEKEAGGAAEAGRGGGRAGAGGVRGGWGIRGVRAGVGGRGGC
ncbi:hypothetical protein B484DRAFT_166244 [Ochromonadaceae sp. CCMP2298]|nr:hypothetical protein B484DRAFT_166244 [Ochromonadaceae sp. CCMP2298]